MARFLLLVCLWAVVLPAVIEKCHAQEKSGSKSCPKNKVDMCAETGQTCDAETGNCKCEPPKDMHDGKCTACPKNKVDKCAESGKTCDAETGNCKCESPKEMHDGKCTACPKNKVDMCAETGQTCDAETGNCKCEPPKEMEDGKCTACPKKKVDMCAETGQICDAETGNCKCEPPKEMDDGKCKVLLACPKNKVDMCAETGQTCDAETGNCKCEPPKEMHDGKCTACPKNKVDTCAETGQTCDAETGNCKCEPPKEMHDGKCTDPCEQKLQECQNGKKTSCKVVDGTPTCVCPSSMKETENGDCFVAKKITVKFTLKHRNKRSTTYGQDRNCNFNITVLIEEIMDTVPNAIEESIVCSGNDVSFDVFAENEDAETEIKNVFNNCTKDDCSLGSSIHFASNSFKFEAKDMCKEEETKKLAEQMGMTCKFNSTTEMLCNKEKTMAIGTANVQGIPFQICRALPCHQTCKNENMSCVQESCVCKPQYKFEDGECKSVCHLKTSVCPAGATCVLGKGDQSFYCECPPKLTGPLCTRENKPLQTAKLNIVVVGVVLASLLLLCFVVSASIISRLRKKVQGPSFSKDCERRPQRELRGYDGPYKASDPASLHRGRDHTSL